MDEKKATEAGNARTRSRRVKWTREHIRKMLQSGKFKRRGEFSKTLSLKGREFVRNHCADLVMEFLGPEVRSGSPPKRYTEVEARRILDEECYGNIKMFRDRYRAAYEMLKKKAPGQKISTDGIWGAPESTTPPPMPSEKTARED